MYYITLDYRKEAKKYIKIFKEEKIKMFNFLSVEYFLLFINKSQNFNLPSSSNFICNGSKYENYSC